MITCTTLRQSINSLHASDLPAFAKRQILEDVADLAAMLAADVDDYCFDDDPEDADIRLYIEDRAA